MPFTIESIPLNTEYFRGPQGFTGPAGPVGVERGGTGAVGAQGEAGPAGAQGVQGAPGIDLIGPRGLIGVVGIIGDFGEFGPTGSIGPQGATGPQGAQGFPSLLPSGPPGSPGAQGVTGPAGGGATGAQGEVTGPPGIQGAEGNFVEQKMSTGMIYRDDPSLTLFEANFVPNFELIKSRAAGTHPCNPFNLTVWNQPPLNFRNLGVFSSDILGQPGGFQIQTGCAGVFWFNYNISFKNESEAVDRVIALECQRGPGVTSVIPGSRSSVTIDQDLVHISHNFIYAASAGDEIGVYAANLDGMPNICMDMDNSNFISRLLIPTS